MLVFRSFEANPTKILFDFSWWYNDMYSVDIDTQHVRNVRIAQHVAIMKSQERTEIGNAWFRSKFVYSLRISVDMFMFRIVFSLSLNWWLVCFSYEKKFVYLFVLVLSLQIRSERFSVFGGFYFDEMHIRTSFCLLPCSKLMFTHSGRFTRQSLHVGKSKILVCIVLY